MFGFHLCPTLIPGGFVGVDIFFVISGFLICQLITQQLETEQFSLIQFYTRRMKRLLSVLVVVSVVVTVAAIYLLIPYDLMYFSGSLASTWVYLSNSFFSMILNSAVESSAH